jgi:hypothetical protein
VGTVLATNFCGNPKPVVGNWYEFLPLNGGDIGNRRNWGSEFGWDGIGFWGDRNRAIVTDNDGWSPVFNPIPCNTANYIRFYARCSNDYGQTITVFGLDSNGQPIQQQDSTGVWIPGITLTLQNPFVSTPMTVRTIERVNRQTTQCPVNGYQYDPVNNVLLDLAQYDPQETNPNYQHSVVRGIRGRGVIGNVNGGNPSGCCTTQITALIKVAYQKMFNPTDLVLIENENALLMEIKAIKLEEAGDIAGSSAWEAKAVHELNLALRDKIPLDQVPTAVNIFGTATLRRRRIGSII